MQEARTRPLSVSLPCLPSSLSLPRRPKIESLPLVPCNLSFLVVPLILAMVELSLFGPRKSLLLEMTARHQPSLAGEHLFTLSWSYNTRLTEYLCPVSYGKSMR
jgi:hypothetical protein